jgi:hypothetical protein
VRKAWRKREESTAPAAPKANVYREQHLRELLEVSRRPEVRLSVSQVEALLKWQGTPAGDVRRLVETLDVDQRLTALRNASLRHGPEAA